MLRDIRQNPPADYHQPVIEMETSSSRISVGHTVRGEEAAARRIAYIEGERDLAGVLEAIYAFFASSFDISVAEMQNADRPNQDLKVYWKRVIKKHPQWQALTPPTMAPVCKRVLKCIEKVSPEGLIFCPTKAAARPKKQKRKKKMKSEGKPV